MNAHSRQGSYFIQLNREAMVVTESDPAREALTEARRAQILEAAIQVFAEKGFHRATVRDVARTAGVADGTIYNYFKSKSDLLMAMVAQMAELNQFSSQATGLSGESTPEQLMYFILRNRFDLLERNRAQIQAILPSVVNDAELRDHFYNVLARPALAVLERVWRTQIERGQVRPVNPQILMRAVLAMFLGLAILDIAGDDVVRGSRDGLVEEVADLLLRGLLPGAGQANEAGEGA